MSYLLGVKAIKSLIDGGDSLAYFRAKLDPALFKGEEEQKLFQFVDGHFAKYRVMPQPETVIGNFSTFAEVDAVEGSQYYLDKLLERYEYDTLSTLTNAVHGVLQDDKTAVDKASQLIDTAQKAITKQKHRRQILDMGADGASMIMTAYKSKLVDEIPTSVFGWPYMDHLTSGIGPGEVVSYVGRPAQGKTWFLAYGAIKNWKRGMKVLLVSMEMNTLLISQRITAMYSGVSMSGLKDAALSSPQVQRLKDKLLLMQTEKGSLYILDGNLTTNIEDIYALAYQLGCTVVDIDGAYLVRSVNPRLGRYERVAENAEYMKRASSEIEVSTFASWQFNRDATKKDAKKGQKVGVEDIGSSDVIGQVSSVVLGLMQEDGVETLQKRKITVIKGRNGETGSFDVNWEFNTMNFDQVTDQGSNKTLEFV